MKNVRNDKKRTAIILGASVLSAAWLIAGPETLIKLGISGTANDLLTWMPAMVLYFGSIACNKKVWACEVRTFKRLIGR